MHFEYEYMCVYVVRFEHGLVTGESMYALKNASVCDHALLYTIGKVSFTRNSMHYCELLTVLFVLLLL